MKDHDGRTAPDDEPTAMDFLSDGGPDRIGAYKILEKLGEGGMGVVYLAEQTEPVRRRVALKVIKHGMATKHVIARFEAERQALALMDHPAIAKIFDAAATADGRPYFAMEFVRGVPITEHCDRHKLTNRERLDLFLQVCDGVQHAHQKAVIHRDLKPSNVLVSIQDGLPVSKIIDFGVAKAVAQRLTERTLHTELGVMIGTPEYMSPEQAEMTGQDVDTRSDVYSLGVMLYELLVGALPFEPTELRQAGFDAFRRRIREEDPPRPSARLSTLGDRSTESARRRRTEPKALRRELLGDLDWITMRALEKDRSRRYGSASALGDDILRYLRFEAVLAHAPSTGYRAWKFVRRHRLGVVAAAVMVVGLAAGTIGSTVGLVRARRAQARALQEAQAKGQVADFLKNLFKVSNPSEARGNSITARELLDKAAGRIDTELSEQPETRAELAAIMGEVYESLGLYGTAETLLGKALELRERVRGSEHPETLQSMRHLAVVYSKQGRYPEAERLFAATHEIRKRVFGPEHPDTLSALNNLAITHNRQGRYREAERLFAEVLEIRQRTLGPEHLDTLGVMNNLAGLYFGQGRYLEAEGLFRETLEARKRVLGPEHPETLWAMNNLAGTYCEQGRYPEAEALHRETLEIRKRVLGPVHPDTLTSMNNLGNVYSDLGRYSQAEALYRSTLEARQRVLGPEHPDTVKSIGNLGRLCARQGRYPEAERLHREVLEIFTRLLGPTHPNTLQCLYHLACASSLRGERTQAMRWLRRAVDGGYALAQQMARDSDLKALHGAEFDALLEQARRNAAAAQAPARDQPNG